MSLAKVGERLRRCRCHSRNNAGIMASAKAAAPMIPPNIGAAMRRITSAPVPSLSMMGVSPANREAAVIATGLRRRAAPSRTASARCSAERAPLACSTRSRRSRTASSK